jgi:hypothetical protein
MRERTVSLKSLGLVALTLLAVAGCGGEPRHESVSGTVTFDGSPLELAKIEFRPDPENGLAVGAMIEGGQYRLPNPPGLPPGHYRVRIVSVADSAARPNQPPDLDLSQGPKAERIPGRYNQATTLQAEVLAGGSSFDFALTSQP